MASNSMVIGSLTNSQIRGSQPRPSFLKKYPILHNEKAPEKHSLTGFKSNMDINKQFTFLATIGKGAYGSVYLVESNVDPKMKEIFALKVLEQADKHSTHQEKEEHVKNLSQELSIMEALQGSPFIIQLYGNVFQKQKFYFIMEYACGGDMFFHIRKAKHFSLQRTQFYAAELLLAIEFMHKNGVIYRDLKPENVLIDREGHIKIIDFGLSSFKDIRASISDNQSMGSN